MNIINGGKHAGNLLAPQEFMIAPYKATSMHEAMKWGMEVYAVLKANLKKTYGISAIAVGDEGGFAPMAINNGEGALAEICKAIEGAGLKGKVGICMDVAASEMYNAEKKMYDLNFKGDKAELLTGEQLGALYMKWIKEFPIISIEDPFDEDDFTSYANLLANIQKEKLGV